MGDSVYRVTEVVGSSSESWEDAARSAVATAAKTVRDLRIAEVVRQDVTMEDGKIGSPLGLGVIHRWGSVIWMPAQQR